MIRVGIIGGAGYTAGELIRILVNHPEVELVFVHSESNAGNPVSDVHQGLLGDTDLVFCSEYDLGSIDVLFLCSGHGKSEEFWKVHVKPENLKVIDLAQDFRDEHDGYVYGLPEWQKDKIAATDRLANPGCFATCIQLALLPLAAAGLLDGDINVTAITGSTGAGVKPGATTHFSWRNNNISTYKVFEHQHLLEINRNLSLASVAGGVSEDSSLRSVPPQAVPPLTMPRVARSSDTPPATDSQLCPLHANPSTTSMAQSTYVSPATDSPLCSLHANPSTASMAQSTYVSPATGWKLNFVPMRGDFARGIFATAIVSCRLSEEEAVKLYKEYYSSAAFTFVCNRPIDLKDAVNTNKAILHIEKHSDKLVITAVIDNLLKGASGQAVQNMNIMFGLPETTGLKLKASAF